MNHRQRLRHFLDVFWTGDALVIKGDAVKLGVAFDLLQMRGETSSNGLLIFVNRLRKPLTHLAANKHRNIWFSDQILPPNSC